MSFRKAVKAVLAKMVVGATLGSIFYLVVHDNVTYALEVLAALGIQKKVVLDTYLSEQD